MKVGRRGFFGALLAAPILAKVRAVEVKPVPEIKVAVAPPAALYQAVHTSTLSTTICLTFHRPILGYGDYMHPSFQIPQERK